MSYRSLLYCKIQELVGKPDLQERI